MNIPGSALDAVRRGETVELQVPRIPIGASDAIEVAPVNDERFMAPLWQYRVRDSYGSTVAFESGFQSEALAREAALKAFDEYCEEPTEVVERNPRSYSGLHWTARSTPDGWSWCIYTGGPGLMAIECGHRVQSIEETFSAIKSAMDRYLDSKNNEPRPAA